MEARAQAVVMVMEMVVVVVGGCEGERVTKGNNLVLALKGGSVVIEPQIRAVSKEAGDIHSKRWEKV